MLRLIGAYCYWLIFFKNMRSGDWDYCFPVTDHEKLRFGELYFVSVRFELSVFYDELIDN